MTASVNRRPASNSTTGFGRVMKLMMSEKSQDPHALATHSCILQKKSFKFKQVLFHSTRWSRTQVTENGMQHVRVIQCVRHKQMLHLTASECFGTEISEMESHVDDNTLTLLWRQE